LAVVACAVLGVFLVCEHNPNISQAAAYTQSLDEMEVTAQGGNALRRVMFFLLGGVGLALAFSTWKKPWAVNPLLTISLLAVPLWCWASLTWALDFGMCFRRLIVLSCFCLGAFGVGRRFSLKEIAWIGFAVTLAASIFGVLSELRLGTFRPWSGDYRFSGSLHPNTQGMYLAWLALSSLTLARLNARFFWQYLACFAWAMILLILTKSRTATAATLVGLAVVGMLQPPLRWQLAVGGGGAWCAGLGYLLTSILGIDLKRDLQSAIFLGREEQAESFTGRGEIWPEVMHFIEQRPLCGYGYESFWTPQNIERVSTAVEWAVREAHCSYLEVILWLGVIGLVLGLIAIGLTTIFAARHYFRTGQPTFAMLVGMVGFTLVDMTMESGMVVTMAVVFFCVAVMWNMAVNVAANFEVEESSPTVRAASIAARPRIRPRRRVPVA
jgi:O-antigen ligase